MKQKSWPIVAVAGHICLDIIPVFEGSPVIEPGKLFSIGPAITSTGGAVSNTGLALHRLGFPARLIGKVGDDLLGRAILNELEQYDPALAEGMTLAAEEKSSYTIVVNPPEADRCFWHYSGTNDTFGSEQVESQSMEGLRLFHLGYPSIMRKLYENEGAELLRIVRHVKEQGLTMSLDLAEIDPSSPAAQQDWKRIFSKVLPYVDVFLPSLEELLALLRPELFNDMKHRYGHDLLANIDAELLYDLAEELLAWGVAVAGIKLGSSGLYIRTSGSKERLRQMGASSPQNVDDWCGRELLAPCFEVNVKGTTGAGDCTIAGFIGGLLQELSLEETILRAVAVGACNVEAADALSGIPEWSALEARLAAGWKQRTLLLSSMDWKYDELICLYRRRLNLC
ncbi:MAG: carbohydrate kinase family protein [Gorillibacterium sp.]|nr:carbohydrate kinase family protein [Gorillibacterium sp.]